jgi:Predicted hydrolases or acyltransferases (alpha/beta hydrolase superfamily)
MLSDDIVESEDSAAADEVVREIVTGQPFGPREETGRDGVLIVGQPSKRRREATLRAIALDALTDLVRQTTYWGEDRVDLEARVGDFRFLVLDFRRGDGLLLYVQIWSTPAQETILEIGADKLDELRDAFIESASEPLRSRGFEIGGKASNFRKFLPVPRSKDPARIAREMLGLLTEVLGYEGSMALTYRMRQGTFLGAAHVINGITRPALQTFLRVWGLETTVRSDDAPVLLARSHGINFSIELLVPQESAPGMYWEVHCRAEFAIPRERVADLLAEVNGKAWLVKASESPVSDKYTFENISHVIEGFTASVGFDRYAVYVFDYGAPVGFRLAAMNPGKVSAIISQNGNAYEEGLSDGWNPIRAYWADPSAANRNALRAFLAPQTTIWQYTQGVRDTSLVSPDGYSLDNFYLARPGSDEVQLDLLGDYKSNISAYPLFHKYFREHRPPFLAVWGKNDPFFLPAGAEAFKQDLPAAIVRLLDTGHFALETHAGEIAAEIRTFLN